MSQDIVYIISQCLRTKYRHNSASTNNKYVNYLKTQRILNLPQMVHVVHQKKSPLIFELKVNYHTLNPTLKLITKTQSWFNYTVPIAVLCIHGKVVEKTLAVAGVRNPHAMFQP